MFEFDDIEAALRILDELEDYYGPGDPRNEYERIVVAAVDGKGAEHHAYMYVYTNEQENWLSHNAVHLPGGDWLHRELD